MGTGVRPSLSGGAAIDARTHDRELQKVSAGGGGGTAGIGPLERDSRPVGADYRQPGEDDKPKAATPKKPAAPGDEPPAA